MATSNPLIGTTWTQVAATDDEFTLGLQANDGTGNLLAVAVTDDDEEPEIDGQVIGPPGNAVNRALTGPGYVWVKSLGAKRAPIWLHTWTIS